MNELYCCKCGTSIEVVYTDENPTWDALFEEQEDGTVEHCCDGNICKSEPGDEYYYACGCDDHISDDWTEGIADGRYSFDPKEWEKHKAEKEAAEPS